MPEFSEAVPGSIVNKPMTYTTMFVLKSLEDNALAWWTGTLQGSYHNYEVWLVENEWIVYMTPNSIDRKRLSEWETRQVLYGLKIDTFDQDKWDQEPTNLKAVEAAAKLAAIELHGDFSLPDQTKGTTGWLVEVAKRVAV